ncbi:MAG: tetratricopeptide repeat protein [Pirellulales bacterium]|nr:tetratricopeptide repeat protein [Pirellulales bacterium]
MKPRSPSGTTAPLGESRPKEPHLPREGSGHPEASELRAGKRGEVGRRSAVWRWAAIWLATWVGLSGWRIGILPAPPYGGSATSLFVEADWLDTNQFDYRRLLQVEKPFRAGGPRAQGTSVVPTLVALLFRAGLSPTAVFAVMHLATLACAAALLLVVYAWLRPIGGWWGSLAVTAAVLTTPLFSVQVDMIGNDLAAATFVAVAGLLAVGNRLGWAALATLAGFAIKSSCLIATTAIWSYAIVSLVATRLSVHDGSRLPSAARRSRVADILGFVLLSALLILQGLIAGWVYFEARPANGFAALHDYLGWSASLSLYPDVAALVVVLAAATVIVAGVGGRKLLLQRAAAGAGAGEATVSTRLLQRPELFLAWLIVSGIFVGVLFVEDPLPRNLTMAVPFLYVIAGSLCLRESRWRPLAIGCIWLLVGVNLVNRSGLLFPQLQTWARSSDLLERSHEYRVDQRSTIAALDKVAAELKSDEALIAGGPFDCYLALPRLGYVARPVGGYAVNAFEAEGWFAVARLIKDRPRRLMCVVTDNVDYSQGQITVPFPNPQDDRQEILFSDHLPSPLIVLRQDLTGVASDDATLDRWYIDHLWYSPSLGEGPTLSLVSRARSLAAADCRPQAIELLRKGLADKPADLDLQLELAKQLLESGQYDEGLAYAHEVAWFDDTRAGAFDALGLGRMGQGKFDVALAEFQAAIDRDPNLDDARYHMAIAYLRKNDTIKAEAALRALLARNPRHADARYQLGMIAALTGKFDEAVREFDELSRREPERADAAVAAGVARLRQQRGADAERRFRDAIARQPDYAEAKNYLGLLLLGKSQLEPAERLFREAIAAQPKFAEPYNNLAVLLARTERFEEAELQLRAAIQLNRNYVEAYNNLGMVLARRERWPAARDCFVQALQIDPNHAGAQQNLQRVQEKLSGSVP